jgi:hypothetical protein
MTSIFAYTLKPFQHPAQVVPDPPAQDGGVMIHSIRGWRGKVQS